MKPMTKIIVHRIDRSDRARPMMEQIRPAVAMDFPPGSDLPLRERTMPAILRMIARILLNQIVTRDKIPKVSPAMALVWVAFLSTSAYLS